MNSSLFISTFKFYTLFILFNTVSSDEKPIEIKEVIEAIDKWTAVGVNANLFAKKGTVDTAIKLMETLGLAIPYVGPITTLLSGLIALQDNTPSEFVVVLEKFNEMSNKLDKIEDQINGLLSKMEESLIILNFKNEVKVMIELKNAYRRFITNPNNITRDDLKHECKVNKMMKLAQWLEREMDENTEMSLKKVFYDEYDMDKFVKWSNQITALLAKATYLHTICLSILDYDEDTKIKVWLGVNKN